jgi:hypothetical protein
MAKTKFEVVVDGEVEEVSTKTEAKQTVLEALADGEEHVIAVEEVDEKARAEEEAAAKAAAEDIAQNGIRHYL